MFGRHQLLDSSGNIRPLPSALLNFFLPIPSLPCLALLWNRQADSISLHHLQHQCMLNVTSLSYIVLQFLIYDLIFKNIIFFVYAWPQANYLLKNVMASVYLTFSMQYHVRESKFSYNGYQFTLNSILLTQNKTFLFSFGPLFWGNTSSSLRKKILQKKLLLLLSYFEFF